MCHNHLSKLEVFECENQLITSLDLTPPNPTPLFGLCLGGLLIRSFRGPHMSYSNESLTLNKCFADGHGVQQDLLVSI